VKATDGSKDIRAAKKKAAAQRPNDSRDGDGDRMQNLGPERQRAAEMERTPASDSTAPQRFDAGRHRFRRRQRIGVHEEKKLSPSLAGPRGLASRQPGPRAHRHTRAPYPRA